MINILGLINFNLFDKIWQIALLVAVVTILGYCIRYPGGRWFIGVALTIAFIGLTSYCGIQLNYYYNESGGIYGQIVSMYNPNQVHITNNVEYIFENIVMTKESDIKYSAKIISDSVLDLNLDDDLTYGVYVNGMPCNQIDISNDYVLAKYEYNFLDEDLNLLLNDTLTLKFAFYTNSTYLIVSTDGGAKAVKYWEYYFNKNIFKVTIDNDGYEFKQDINLGSGDVSSYSIVNYYLEDVLSFKQIYKNGDTINLPESDKYLWKLDNGESINNSYVIDGSISLYSSPFVVFFDANGGELDVTSKKLYATEVFGDLPIPTREDYEFNGWYTVDGILVTSSDIMGSSDITLRARWIAPQYDVLCEFDETTSTYFVKKPVDSNVTAISIPLTYNDGTHGSAPVTKIGNSAFYDLETLESITISNNVISIGSYAFNGCTNLKNIVLPSNLINIDNCAFYRSGLESIVIPSSLTTLGESVFENCRALTSVSFEDGSNCKTINYGAFAYCSSLNNIKLSTNLQIIGQGAFYGCTALSEITIPATVTRINKGAFQDCSNLKTMTILSVEPPVLENINGISTAITTIYIVSEINVYLNVSNWSNFAGKFVQI